ncbi:MAG TPA: PIN domain-containing protein [Acidobacteriaceae bacterium]
MTSIDTNAILGLFNEDEAFNLPAKRCLQKAAAKGPLTICAPVFVELCAMPKRDGFDLEIFLQRARIDVDWLLEEEIWRKAGAANARHLARRRDGARHSRKHHAPHETKRVAADFLIGAHAMVRGAELLTFDKGVFRTYFPSVKIVEP